MAASRAPRVRRAVLAGTLIGARGTADPASPVCEPGSGVSLRAILALRERNEGNLGCGIWNLECQRKGGEQTRRGTICWSGPS